MNSLCLFLHLRLGFFEGRVVYDLDPSSSEYLVEISAFGIQVCSDKMPVIVDCRKRRIHYYELGGVAEDFSANVGQQVQSTF